MIPKRWPQQLHGSWQTMCSGGTWVDVVESMQRNIARGRSRQEKSRRFARHEGLFGCPVALCKDSVDSLRRFGRLVSLTISLIYLLILLYSSIILDSTLACFVIYAESIITIVTCG